jgi:hypothetical protein
MCVQTFGVKILTMSLEFVKVIEQVHKMGDYLGKRETTLQARLEIALAWYHAARDLEAAHDRIQAVRTSSISGYRGAAPAPPPYDEAIPFREATPAAPEQAAIIAVDGSQVYPDIHTIALYYLINLGVFTYFHGVGRVPQQATYPDLVYTTSLLEDKDGRMITNQTVNARRTVAEMQHLAKQAWALDGAMQNGQEAPLPIFAIHDGGLLKFFGPTEIADASGLEDEYRVALQKLNDSHAYLCGYIERSTSASLISLLHLLNLPLDQVNDASLKTNGIIEGVTDAALFARVLRPGERSAIYAQNSPQNLTYKRMLGEEFEIAFFYINVGESRPQIVRVEIPMWVGRDKGIVAALHSLLVSQCAVQGRQHYPYALTRADELAYINHAEKQQLEELIRVEMLKQRMQPDSSSKLETKHLARAGKQQYRLGV